MSNSSDFDDVDRFTAGAVGEPGQRVFYLQAVAAGTVVSCKCEKQQVAALAEYLSGVLADLPPTEPPPAGELVEPVLAEWTAGTMAVAYDENADRIVLIVNELVPEAEGDDPEAAPMLDDDVGRLRLRLTRGQVAAFIALVPTLVSAGRPPCELCGRPKGADHSCPRTNGHHPPS